jgi:inner membrane protein
MKVLTGARSWLGKGISLAVVMVIIEMAIAEVWGVLDERMSRRDEAEVNITEMAGGEQLLEGPIFIVPEGDLFEEPASISIEASGGGVSELAHRPSRSSRERPFRIEPFDKIRLKADLASETIYRGIYSFQTFLSTVTISGELALSEEMLSLPKIPDTPSGLVVLRFSDRHSIRAIEEMTLDGKELDLKPLNSDNALAFTVPHEVITNPNRVHSLRAIFKVRGTKSFSVSPMSHVWDVSLVANTRNPSFSGSLLAEERSVNPDGSSARWHGERFSTQLVCFPECESQHHYFAQNRNPVGITLLDGISAYHSVERAIKYRELVVILIFGTFLLFEFLTKIRLHPFQYLLVGVALSLFYLLTLTLGEHIGLALAYSIASAATVSLVAGYSSAVLRNWRHGATVGALLSVTYGFLYSLLREQEGALLLGSIGLAVGLGAIMFVTRRVDWYSLGGLDAE